jgi:hypothetical protein
MADMPFVSVPNEALCDEYERIRDNETPDYVRGWMDNERRRHDSAWTGGLIMDYDWRQMDKEAAIIEGSETP